MGRLGRPKGLVRYDSILGMRGLARRLIRPRTVLYAALAIVGLTAATLAAWSHTDLEVTVARLAGAPYSMEGEMRNGFDLTVVNKGGQTRSFELSCSVPPGAMAVVSTPNFRLAPLERAHVAIFVTRAAPRTGAQNTQAAAVRVHDLTTHRDQTAALTLLGP
jgi:hypothetical protein